MKIRTLDQIFAATIMAISAYELTLQASITHFRVAENWLKYGIFGVSLLVLLGVYYGVKIAFYLEGIGKTLLLLLLLFFAFPLYTGPHSKTAAPMDRFELVAFGLDLAFGLYCLARALKWNAGGSGSSRRRRSTSSSRSKAKPKTTAPRPAAKKKSGSKPQRHSSSVATKPKRRD